MSFTPYETEDQPLPLEGEPHGDDYWQCVQHQCDGVHHYYVQKPRLVS